MIFQLRFLHIIFFLFPLLLNAVLPIQTMAHPHKIPTYELHVTFEPEKHQLNGTAHITLEAGEDLYLDFTGLTVNSIVLNRDKAEALVVQIPDSPQFHLPSSPSSQELYISYSKVIGRSYDNRIDETGIILTNGWHPLPDRESLFNLKCTVPKGFTAISQTDHFQPTARNNQYSFSFSKPLVAIHLAAAPYSIGHLKIRDGLSVYTLFFKEDEALADEYLKKTAEYIGRYEKEIGPFPYQHYAVVENPLPVGYGMDTFTLLGQMVIRLPFIKDSSLGHEVLHSWFGNSVEVDYSSGNWCEGLTTYLADQAYLRDKGQGAQSRKNTLVNYFSYVHDNKAITLADFHSASHNQPLAKAVRGVGYGRGSMLFHELKQKIGEDLFSQGLKKFYSDFKGKRASWKDIETTFSTVSSLDLTRFFLERLSSTDIAHFTIDSLSLSANEAGYQLSFTVEQKTDKPFSLHLPVVIKTTSGNIPFTRQVKEKRTTLTFTLPENPLAITIDPNYDLMRRLDNREIPPALSHFFGAEKKLAILESEAARTIYEPVIKRLQNSNWKITTAQQVKNSELSKQSILFLGTDSTASKALFAEINHPQSGFTLEVRKNPLDSSHVAVMINAGSADEAKAVARKLSHYGKYSYLHFQRGRIQEKKIAPSQSGLQFEIDRLPPGGSTKGLGNFEKIVDELSSKRVVYVGETHTSIADHILQFRIIEALYKRNPNLAIGMEMFPSSSQQALDDYINGSSNMDERTFLKKSRYFKVWRYDFRLFRAIFNFAKKNKIPVIGLNLNREIVSSIFKNGSTDKLSPEQQKILPVDRKLDMDGYSDRLEGVHQMHMSGRHGSGSFAGFIQSQALWDETMAHNIHTYLQAHPKTNMVVLAGSQHTRKDSGIPPRVARRMEVEQASVLNISTGLTDDLANQADYYFLAGSGELEETAKIGIVLNQIKKESTDYLQIIQISPHGHAEKAGIQKNDILLAINGLPINTMEDVRIAMIDATEGQKVTIKVGRTVDSEEQELELPVTLYRPRAQKPHP